MKVFTKRLYQMSSKHGDPTVVRSILARLLVVRTSDYLETYIAISMRRVRPVHWHSQHLVAFVRKHKLLHKLLRYSREGDDIDFYEQCSLFGHHDLF
jgi:hypothetical protein